MSYENYRARAKRIEYLEDLLILVEEMLRAKTERQAEKAVLKAQALVKEIKRLPAPNRMNDS